MEGPAVTFAFWILVLFATLAGLFMAWALGANSNSPPFAPAIGANAISTMRAAFLIGIFAAAGALTQGGAISETVGADLIGGVTITPLAASTGLLVAASFMIFGVYTGYPVPAAFATTGAMVGVGLSLGGDPAFGTYRRIGTFWLLVPPVSGGLAFLTATLLRRDEVPETVGVPSRGDPTPGSRPGIVCRSHRDSCWPPDGCRGRRCRRDRYTACRRSRLHLYPP